MRLIVLDTNVLVPARINPKDTTFLSLGSCGWRVARHRGNPALPRKHSRRHGRHPRWVRDTIVRPKSVAPTVCL